VSSYIYPDPDIVSDQIWGIVFPIEDNGNETEVELHCGEKPKLPVNQTAYLSCFSVGAIFESALLNLEGKLGDRGTLKFILQFGKVILI
jgi:hypothetical protein